MGRKASGFRTAVKVVKAIDRASKQAARERQQQLRAEERSYEQARRQSIREQEAYERQKKKARLAETRAKENKKRQDEIARRAQERSKKQAIKNEFKDAKACYERRTAQRLKLKEAAIGKYMR